MKTLLLAVALVVLAGCSRPGSFEPADAPAEGTNASSTVLPSAPVPTTGTNALATNVPPPNPGR